MLSLRFKMLHVNEEEDLTKLRKKLAPLQSARMRCLSEEVLSFCGL